MLKLYIEGRELFDEETSSFYSIKPQTISIEHSLVSISKWESKWHKPFLKNAHNSNTGISTTEEFIDYVKCMTLTQNVNPLVYACLSNENINQIAEYIEDPMTATTFSDTRPGGSDNSVITAELIYYNMISYGVPMECQKWHLNRLLALLRVCAIKNSSESGKKMSKSEVMARNRALNAQRRAKHGTRG